MPATSSRWPASRKSRTGDTLCDPNKPVILEKMEFPEPVIEIAIEPKSKADQEKLGVALAKLAAEDPSFRVSTDQESGQTILKGMGELHLDIKVDILRAPTRSTPISARRRWPIRETHHAAGRDRLHPQEADRRYGPVRPRQVRRRAERAGHGLRVRDRRSSAARCRRNTSRASRRASKSVLGSGVLAGFPVVDFKVDADRRRLPRRRLVGARLRNRLARGASAKRCRRAARCCSSRS